MPDRRSALLSSGGRMTTPWKIGSRLYLARSALDDLIQALRRQGYSVLGPRLADGAISLLPIESAAQLPQGLSDEQEGGCTAWWTESPN